MKLRAIVVGNPGEPGEQGYCEGVNRDVESYSKFLRSAIGGGWEKEEVVTLRRPSAETLREELRSLKDVDYSLIVFAGHGYVDSQTRSTVLTLKRGHQIDSIELRRGASKHTLVLDCCRKVETRTMMEARLQKALVAKYELSSRECRMYYERELAKCPTGIIVLHACSIGETAGDDPAAGGYYSSSLLTAAGEWAESRKVDPEKYYTLSVVEAHQLTEPRVDALSGGLQHPKIEKPRSEPYFPFCLVP